MSEDDAILTAEQTWAMARSIVAATVDRAADHIQMLTGDDLDATASVASSTSFSTASRCLPIHPLHSHLLLYGQVCDSKKILYAMQCVRNVLASNPRLSLCTLSATNLSASRASSRVAQIQTLLARHRKSVFGKGFAGSLLPENMTTFRNATLIEVLVSTLLYYLRSFYPNLGQVGKATMNIFILTS